MKKPVKFIYENDAYSAGWDASCGVWQAYFNWYIKEHCVKKEDLPEENEIIDIIIYSDISGLALREVVNNKIKASRYDNAINKLAQTIVKRIRGE